MKKCIKIISILLILSFCNSINLFADDILVELPDTTFDSGSSNVFIPIYTGDVTGQNITSVYFSISFNGNIVQCISFSKQNSILDAWNNPSVNIQNNNISIAAYGVSPISGSGILCYLEFNVIGQNGDYSNLHFDFFQYNEGVPSVVTNDGIIFVGNTITPPSADFVADTTFGYEQLQVNFSDLSSMGSGSIVEWFWSFGDGTDTTYAVFTDTITHIYNSIDSFTVSLTVSDEFDSTDTVIKNDYITVSAYEPPTSPENVAINISGTDAIITWDLVDTTIYGNPIDVDCYLVYYCGSPDSVYYFLGLTADTTYTHEHVVQFSDNMFYQVTSYLGEIDVLLSVIKEHPDIKLAELDRLLKKVALQKKNLK